MGKLQGTQTLVNLMTSFVGECQARMRYTYFASIAKKEGYVQISEIFTETAGNYIGTKACAQIHTDGRIM